MRLSLLSSMPSLPSKPFVPAALSLLLLFGSGSNQAAAAEPMQPAAAAIEPFIARYGQVHRELGLGGEMELFFLKSISKIDKETDLPAQRQQLLALNQAQHALDRPAATACQRLQLEQIDFELDLHLHKLQVLERFRALGSGAQLSEQGLAQSALGKDWYRWLRKAWLTQERSASDLMAMGHAELARAQGRYRALQARMGYAGRDADFAAYLAGPDFRYPEGATPQADYEARQAIVERHMARLFPATGITGPAIKASTLGAALPVDGYYEPDEATFYFNKAREGYGRRNVDWLLLHESTPGHHYQSRYAQAGRGCPLGLPHGFYSAYAEGWGAYVEEYGAELGLFQQDGDALGAVEWDLVRSIRVVLDVGLNELGWSEAEAQAYWREQLPMLPALAEREIRRVRQWPAQAITYKQGAVLLRELRSEMQAREGARFDIREFHDRVLKHGPLPLSLLRERVLATPEPRAQNQAAAQNSAP
ncbi:DUF885 domain-containing protein [Paucibacter sp. DJ2R-2]|uniref:DUF885 domain-containing protein n=1 Tax=Paucibacter sp. DJ2R-2 TaxID=2893558 RepID=UPI0021E367CE|nr:DUF885 domain-containing protein [Paucibacter sp. DJ2R-2]MCV2419747.1 DUF885 domain-containing protein [Paucibacter sp. DJ4R-1]MCV2437350.1 DUF885 domain-containing protein [Paucibacter sp. DJ2R-2]